MKDNFLSFNLQFLFNFLINPSLLKKQILIHIKNHEHYERTKNDDMLDRNQMKNFQRLKKNSDQEKMHKEQRPISVLKQAHGGYQNGTKYRDIAHVADFTSA